MVSFGQDSPVDKRDHFIYLYNIKVDGFLPLMASITNLHTLKFTGYISKAINLTL